MKVSALAPVFLVSLANASKCKPATYRCEDNAIGWDVCNAAGDWTVRRPSNVSCAFEPRFAYDF